MNEYFAFQVLLRIHSGCFWRLWVLTLWFWTGAACLVCLGGNTILLWDSSEGDVKCMATVSRLENVVWKRVFRMIWNQLEWLTQCKQSVDCIEWNGKRQACTLRGNRMGNGDEIFKDDHSSHLATFIFLDALDVSLRHYCVAQLCEEGNATLDEDFGY